MVVFQRSAGGKTVMPEIKTNAQLRMNQIVSIPNRKKKSYQASGHIGEVKILNFPDGTKIVEFDSKDGEISFTIVTNEPFQIVARQPPITFKNNPKEEEVKHDE
jgi:hypothetical protein